MNKISKTALIFSLLAHSVQANTHYISQETSKKVTKTIPAYSQIKKQNVPSLAAPIILGGLGIMLTLCLFKISNESTSRDAFIKKLRKEKVHGFTEGAYILYKNQIYIFRILGGTLGVIGIAFISLAAYKLKSRYKIKKQQEEREQAKIAYKKAQLVKKPTLHH